MKRMGTCGVCGRRVALYMTGTVYRHRNQTIGSFYRGLVCKGSQKPPVTE